MKALIVEDDVVSRKLMQSILSPYGDCHTATDGSEGVTRRAKEYFAREK